MSRGDEVRELAKQLFMSGQSVRNNLAEKLLMEWLGEVGDRKVSFVEIGQATTAIHCRLAHAASEECLKISTAFIDGLDGEDYTNEELKEKYPLPITEINEEENEDE